uniref:response regulator transcription factor n=1 Tax=Marinobacterium profundum TaxID=1714300 RepID=UPI00082D1DAD|nr:response regulator transcription factor [Marinobacterium profundum]
MNSEDAPLILAVNHNRRNLDLLVQFLSQDGYRILAVTSLEEFDQALSAEQRIEMAVVDITGFDQSIWRHCDHMRRKQLPYLVLASRWEAAGIQHRGYNHGARYVLAKPTTKKTLRLILNGFCRHSDEADSFDPGP